MRTAVRYKVDASKITDKYGMADQVGWKNIEPLRGAVEFKLKEDWQAAIKRNACRIRRLAQRSRISKTPKCEPHSCLQATFQLRKPFLKTAPR